MPELPEVESIARTLRPLVCGRRIVRVDVPHRIGVKPQTRAWVARGATGRTIRRVERRGKYLVLHLDRGCLVLHFRLDGHLRWFPSGRLEGHVDVALHLSRGTLGFADRRHFGRVHWHAQRDAVAGIRTLGAEPLGPAFTPQRLGDLLRRSRRPLKLLLLDQTRVAGLGNIYASESLWHARLDPRRASDRVTLAEAGRLHKAIVRVLRRALQCCLDPAPDFTDPEWWFEGLEPMLRVYGREGLACRRCRQAIRRIEQGGRSSYFCPRCQK